MKSLIICPAERPAVIHLSEHLPLVANPICGKPFLFYWIEHLVAKGVTHLQILASDRPEVIRSIVEDGSRWGISIEIVPERKELTILEARARYLTNSEGWLSEPMNICVADHLPNRADAQLFSSYEAYINAAESILQYPVSPDRIGLRELAPGVWIGLHSQISASAKLVAPCWIGDRVLLGENVQIGPNAIVESKSIVEDNAHVSFSIIPPETLIGVGTEFKHSIISGDNLINWKTNSSIRIDDPHLLMPLGREPRRKTNLIGRIAALCCLIATAPLALFWTLISGARGQGVIRELKAVAPLAARPTERIIRYREFSNCTGLWQRWPQLWNIVRGEFAWVGNRPLNIIEAGQFTAEFEKLWFNAPIGLVSYADAEGCFDKLSDEARVHACFYAAFQSRKFDFKILSRVILSCGKRNVTAPLTLPAKIEKREEMRLSETAIR